MKVCYVDVCGAQLKRRQTQTFSQRDVSGNTFSSQGKEAFMLEILVITEGATFI